MALIPFDAEHYATEFVDFLGTFDAVAGLTGLPPDAAEFLGQMRWGTYVSSVRHLRELLGNGDIDRLACGSQQRMALGVHWKWLCRMPLQPDEFAAELERDRYRDRHRALLTQLNGDDSPYPAHELLAKLHTVTIQGPLFTFALEGRAWYALFANKLPPMPSPKHRFYDAIVETFSLIEDQLPALEAEQLRAEREATQEEIAAKLVMLTPPLTAFSHAHSSDFRSVRWNDELYSFNASQAPAVRLLWENWTLGTPDVGDESLCHAIDDAAPPKRLDMVFRGNPAWNKMIVPGRSKGTHRIAGSCEK